VFDKRGQLLPRERVALLLDPGAPTCRCARWPATCRTQGCRGVGAGRRHGGRHRLRLGRALHGGGQRFGHRRRRDPGHGLDKILRVQEIALQNKLPFIHLVESAGANLLKYRVEGFVHGGALFAISRACRRPAFR
jgi:geranyl-CoA carboxylase beta subunit